MSTFNDIGISRQLDWNRIRCSFIIGLFGGIMTLIGDWLLGYGVYDESLTGLERKLSQYLALSDEKIFWSAFLGLIGISLEGLCYFGIYRLIENDTYAHISPQRRVRIYAVCGVRCSCAVSVNCVFL